MHCLPSPACAMVSHARTGNTKRQCEHSHRCRRRLRNMAPGRMGCQIEVDTLVEFSESIQANRGLTKVSPALVCCRLHVVVYVACCIRVAVCAPSRGTLSCDRLASAAVARVLSASESRFRSRLQCQSPCGALGRWGVAEVVLGCNSTCCSRVQHLATQCSPLGAG